jgi:hypothetical protein
MALPDATLTILDGALGQLPGSNANVFVKLGICSAGLPNTLYSFTDTTLAQQSLGQGPLVEAMADTLSVAGGPVLAMPLNPTTAGTVGVVAHTGPGSGTVTPSRAPAVSIAIKVTTGGALGTAAIAISLNGGSYAAPVVSVAGSTWAYLVPGTNTTITLVTATYVLNDIYTVATTGVITVVGTGPSGNITQVSSPLDVYDVQVVIAGAGGLGAGIFTYSLDGGTNVSAQILIPSGAGVYVIPGTGVVLTFAGSFTLADLYEFFTTTATFGNSDVTAAFTVLLASAQEWAGAHIVGPSANSAGSASLAATVDAQMSLAETGFRYVFSVVECPTSESDSTISTAFSTFVSKRVGVGVGDAFMVSAISGRSLRRNIAMAYMTRLAAIRPAEHPGWVGSPQGALRNIGSGVINGQRVSLIRDEGKTPFLDAQRFVTARTHIGVSGFYITRGNMMAAGGSDFSSVMNRRVMDMSCRIVRSAAITFLNKDLLIDSKGHIATVEAERIDSFLTQELVAGVVNTNNASSATVDVSRTDNILSTKTLNISVRVTPKGYAEQLVITIGFLNPALALAA